MNKDLLNQIPADEQPMASTLFSMREAMQVSPTFEWDLETQLMDTAKKKTQPAQGWTAKIFPALEWAVLAICAVYLLSSTIRSLGVNQPAVTIEVSNPVIPFESNVRTGNACQGPLAVAHDFSVSLINPDKTGFITLDEQKSIGELRSFAWSPDGKQLAVVGNTTGSGNIYLTDSMGAALQPILPNAELGYLMEVAWSRDGKRLVTWSLQNNSVVYLVNADGTGLLERQLDMQIFATPQFAPDNESILFYGANQTSSGLFEVKLDGSPMRTISALVEDESSFVWSPDGSRLAYMEMDRSLGEAHLVLDDTNNDHKVVIATLPIPIGSGSSIPSSANLSWSMDGKTLVFDFGRGAFDRVVYLAYSDGTGLIKLTDSAYAPAISAAGDCLAYISNKQVFLMDLTGVSMTSTKPTPILLADLPTGRSIADFRLNRLQWGLGTMP